MRELSIMNLRSSVEVDETDLEELVRYHSVIREMKAYYFLKEIIFINQDI